MPKYFWGVSLSSLLGGVLSGFWWPNDAVVGAIAGIIGALCYLGVRFIMRGVY